MIKLPICISHDSLYMNVSDICFKSQICFMNIKRNILVNKIKVKIVFSCFPTSALKNILYYITR